MDKSNGYENIAKRFIEVRGQSANGTGASSVRNWCLALPQGSLVLDLGCGTGIPISKVLIDAGMIVYGIDASPTLINEFRRNFPNNPVTCEPAENSSFFTCKFDAIISWGLIFLLSKDAQVRVIQKVSDSLRTGGKFLFTAPSQETEWIDAMTKLPSRSLGTEMYKKILSASGLQLFEEFEDEGENHYFNAAKI